MPAIVRRMAPSPGAIVVLVAAATVGAAAPAHAQAQAVAAPLPLKVVLLGDSYAAGNGAGDYYGPQGCYRSSSNWAEQYLDALRAQGYAVTFINRACSGAVLDDVLTGWEKHEEFTAIIPGQWAADDPVLETQLAVRAGCWSNYPDEQPFEVTVTRATFDPSLGSTAVDWTCDWSVKAPIDAVGKDTDLVLLTIGGNDAHFGAIVRRCFAPVFGFLGGRDLFKCIEEMEEAQRVVSEDLASDLDRLFSELRWRMRPDARVVLVQYPYLELGSGYTFDGFPVADLIRELGEEGDVVQQAAVDRANDAAATESSTFVSTIKACFEGHEPLGFPEFQNPQRWIWEFERGVPFSLSGNLLENYHPNPT
jgi:lysophospholipase L1-like esterase